MTLPPPVGSLAMLAIPWESRRSRIAAASSGELLLLLKRVLSKAAPTAVAKKTRRIKWSARRQSVDLSAKTACCMPRTCFWAKLRPDRRRASGADRCGAVCARHEAKVGGRSRLAPRRRREMRSARVRPCAGSGGGVGLAAFPPLRYVTQKTDRRQCRGRRVSCSRLVVQKSWKRSVFKETRCISDGRSRAIGCCESPTF